MSPSDQILRPIYLNDPHASVSAQNSLVVTNPRDLDLMSTLQFVDGGGHATLFDFSAFVLVNEDGSDLAAEKSRIGEEVLAFANLLETVQGAYDAFYANAQHALHTMSGLAVV